MDIPRWMRALGAQANCTRFFVYLLTWNAERNKFDKRPIGSPAAASMTFAQAVAEVARIRAAGQPATVGLWIKADSGLFFLDVDKMSTALALDDRGTEALTLFPGSFAEWSVGKHGIHVIGTLAHNVAHASRNDPLHLELYTADRGVALNIDSAPNGCMDAVHDITPIVAKYFAPRAAVDTPPTLIGQSVPDDELWQLMLAAKPSAEVAFNGKVSLASLLQGDAEKNSNNDAALASHLAFWTQRNAGQMKTLMLRSGMARGKWSTHSTYLDTTINNAIAQCASVYTPRMKSPTLAPTLVDVRNGAALMQREFPPVQWALRNLIPQGTALLSAAPKAGKSFLVLQACMAIAAGVPLWPGREPEMAGETLYLDLEGNERRLQERISGLLSSFPTGVSLERFHYDTDWPRGEAGVAKLREWLIEHPQCRLVVIDTLATWRDQDPGRKSAYNFDYSVGEQLKPLVREFPVAILMVSHTRKAVAGDAMDKISGTQGLVGSFDNYMILTRASGDMDAELVVNGRDIKDPQELALHGRKDGGWTCVGKAVDIKRSNERNDVLRALTSIGGVGTPREIRAALDDCVTPGTLHTRLSRMVKAGEIIKSGKLYTVISMLPKLPDTPAA